MEQSVIEEVVQSLGYDALKEKQKEALHHFISGRDVFVSLPTGYGKSLIYGCLPRLLDRFKKLPDGTSIVIVVCPLKALMMDQVKHFRSLGLSAAFVGDRSISLESFLAGQYQLIFLSPETLNRGRIWRDIIRSALYQTNLVSMVVDEAHLVKTW